MPNAAQVRRQAFAERMAMEFNRDHPVGTRVRYFPVAGRAEFVEARTRSAAWSIPSGEAVVMIEGRSGGVSLRHVRVIEEA